MYKGTLIGFSTAGFFALALWWTSDLLYAQTMVLSTLIVTQLAHVFECRAEGLPFWEINLGKNLLLVGAVTEI